MSSKKRLISLIIFALIAFLIATPAYIVRKRSLIYPYEVAQNYHYDFRNTDGEVIDLSLENGKVTVPSYDDTKHTVFLKVSIAATLVGRYFEPSIQITSGGKSVIQYVEHGAKGIRYLNISSLLSKNESEIFLKGKYISIDDQAAQAIIFNKQDLDKARILVLAPHPDDAEIAAYGLYSSYKDVYIVTVTAGDAGSNKYNELYSDKTKQYLEKGKLRTWNSITVPLLGGVPLEHNINLGFFDGTLRTMYEDKSSVAKGIYTHISDIGTYRKQNVSSLAAGLSGKADWDSLVENLEYLLNIIKPDVIVTPYPALDKHYDHKLSSIALFEAIKKCGIRTGKIYFYTNHFVLNEYYPYGKMGGTISLPPNFGESIYFDSMYSHTLSLNNQGDKILALEAMNDLRLDTEWPFFKQAIIIALSNIKSDIMDQENSYYRRAVRSNELFFVVDIGDLYDQAKLGRIVGVL